MEIKIWCKPKVVPIKGYYPGEMDLLFDKENGDNTSMICMLKLMFDMAGWNNVCKKMNCSPLMNSKRVQYGH